MLLWADEAVQRLAASRRSSRWPSASICCESIRYVDRVTMSCWPQDRRRACRLAADHDPPTWVVDEAADTTSPAVFCRAHGLEYRVLRRAELTGFPELAAADAAALRPGARR